MEFAQYLKSAMDNRSVTMYRLAKELGVHQTTIRNWLDGKGEPRISEVQAIAEALGVTVDYLLGKDSEVVRTGTYKDGAIVGTRIRPKDGDEYIELQFDADKMSAMDIQILIDVYARLSEEYGFGADVLAYLMEASAKAAANLQTTPQSPPSPQVGTDTTPSTDAPETAPEGE